MTLFDTNVLLDIATADTVWLAWSEKEFRSAAAQGPIPINPIIYAELAPAFATVTDLDRWLDPAVFQRLPLPDFYIGAHAEVEGHTLVTRDAARHRTYFPNVALIVP